MNDDEKVQALKIVYEEGKKIGQDKFREKYQQFKKAEDTDEQKEKEAEDKLNKEDLKTDLEYMTPDYKKE